MTGLILIDKPEGITSYSAVAKIKRILGEKRVGHTGTLDPLATGVLPVLTGRATALSGLMLDSDKKYTAEIKLGITTDTDDVTGEILSRNTVNVTTAELKQVLKKFTGSILQKPPAYSAIKKDGVRLYSIARQGGKTDIAPRKVTVHEITLLSDISKDGVFKIETTVSKGTYIRSLARDIGETLGCGGTVFSLRRTYAAGFDIKDCVALDSLTEENIKNHILSEETVVNYLEEISVTKNQAVRFCNGGQLSFDRLDLSKENISDSKLFRVKYEDLFLGIGFADTLHLQIGIKCIINYPEGWQK